MTPAELLARLTGLAVAIAGVALVWGGFFVPTAGAPGFALLARGVLIDIVVAAGFVGIGFLLAGLAVFVGRGRSLAVTVGGVVLVAAVALVALGTSSTQSVLAVSLLAFALFFAGASVDGRETA
ncbi:hypothetical protein [Halobellus sp. GM3]|uniref:hypothetical protein n=1 Tax=Halobellus sp. GM3 TaxID=3458410 RepID=UPI00403DD69A